jgi:hypothetical protein
MARRSQLETNLQKACVEWFRFQYPSQYFLLFANNQNGKDQKEQIRLNAMGVVPGVSDLIYISPKGVVFIEMKAPAVPILKKKAGKQSPEQKEWQAQVNALGYHYFLVDSFEKFEWLIKQLNDGGVLDKI